MGRLSQVIQSLLRREADNAVRVADGTVETLNPYGDHTVSVDGGTILARSISDENIRVGDIVKVLFAGQHVLILGGKK